MASSPKLVCLFFLLTTLAFSFQAHGRDSQFFSKVTRNREESPSTTPNTNKFSMNNKENEFEPLNKQQEQEEQPTFIPQTTETGYGLYGHETGLDPPSTTTPSTSLYNMDENNKNNNYESFNSYFKNNHHDTHDDEKNYVPELKGLSSSTTFAPGKFNHNNNYNNHYNNHYNNNNNNNNYNNGNGKYYYGNDVQEKQGMSDTRFLENGKYYYDINSEKNNDFNNNNYMSHPTNYNDNYETNEYYGNKGNRFDAYYDAYYRNNKNNNNNNYDNYNNNNNNNNNFFRGNGMQAYRNQVPQEEEFDFDDQP